MKKILILAMALVLATSGLAVADILDFEDLYPGYETYQPISSPYHGFTLIGVWYMTKYGYSGGGNGYEYGTFDKVSMFNGYANPISLSSSVDFSVQSLYMTSAWDASQTANIKGYKSGSEIYSTTATINNTAPTFVVLNWTGIDQLYFDSGTGDQIVIDNLVYNAAAPLPATLLFFGTGLLALAGRRLRS